MATSRDPESALLQHIEPRLYRPIFSAERGPESLRITVSHTKSKEEVISSQKGSFREINSLSPTWIRAGFIAKFAGYGPAAQLSVKVGGKQLCSDGEEPGDES
jgi:hypothetical protein